MNINLWLNKMLNQMNLQLPSITIFNFILLTLCGLCFLVNVGAYSGLIQPIGKCIFVFKFKILYKCYYK